jgi:hypothetical protein
MKLYIYFNKARTQAVILFRRETEWCMFQWNLETNEIKSGQWLRNKSVDLGKSRMSEDGTYFSLQARYGSWHPVQTISIVPYFTAIHRTFNCGARGDNEETDSKLMTSDMRNEIKWISCGNPDLHQGGAGVSGQHFDSDTKEFVKTADKPTIQINDTTTYKIDQAKLYKNDTLVHDFTEYKFEQVQAPYKGVAKTKTKKPL